MKSIQLFFTICLSLLVGMASAQTDGITYQAVIIDTNPEQIPGVDIPANNLPYVPLDVRFSILNETNTLEYQEVQNTETDAYGMIHLTIGQGSATGGTGAFDEIYWFDEKVLQVEIDLRDGNGYVLFSTQNLTYIPYVKHREIVATSTLDVDGVTNLNDDLNVNNQATTTLSGDLYVEGDAFFVNGNFENITVTERSDLNIVDIMGPTTIDGPTVMNGTVTVNNDFTVGNAAPSNLSGSLTVGGVTNINAPLNINGGNTTNLSGDLIVGGQAFFGDAGFDNITVNQTADFNVLNTTGVSTLGNTLNVSNGSATNLSGTLAVASTTNVGGNFNVNNGSFTNLSGNLSVNNASSTNLTGTLTVAQTSNLNGQVTINANLNGSQTSSASYPLVVRGSDQGIYVVNDGSSRNASNYMTFSNTNGGIQGAIEGQTLTDLQNSYEYFHEFEAAFGIELAFITAEGLACAAQLDLGESGLMAAQAITSGIFWQFTMDYLIDNRGVYFKSGGADYAEYLEKANYQESFMRGEVVGVIGGRISKNTQAADKIMVISSNPIVLGNQQPQDRQEHFEKIAFMGQVPVRVIGKVAIGDYVLASGNNDGLAIAKAADQMQWEDYKKIVGIAWEASRGRQLSLINVAVGINSNDLSDRVAAMEQEMNQLKSQMAQVLQLLEASSDPITTHQSTSLKEPTPQINGQATVWQDQKTTVGFDLEQWLTDYHIFLESYTQEVRKRLQSRGYDLGRNPKLAQWLNDPTGTIRQMNAGVFIPTLWDSVKDQILQNTSSTKK